MTTPVFPALSGQGWSVHKKPNFATIVAAHPSGREVRDAKYINPLWEFELVFDGLDSGSSYPGLGALSLQSLLGLYLQCQGPLATFLYTDPSDNAVAGQMLATGDGARTTFAFARSLGSFLEPVGEVTSVAHVTLNGVNQSSGWSLTPPNSLVFGSAPSPGVIVGASFAYAFLCQFEDDGQDFEQFMSGLWKVDSLKFRTVRTT